MEVEAPTVTGIGDRPYPRLSRTLADVLNGDHVLTGMSHRSRVEYLYGLQKLMDCVLAVGWEEHTNDWDWSVQVELEDGTLHGATYEEPYVHCDSFALDIALEDGGIPYVADDYELTRVSELALLDVMEMDNDKGPTNQLVPIDKIKLIHIEEE